MPAGPEFPLFEKDDPPPVYVVERLLMGNEWATVRDVPCTKRTRCPERLVFFSVKGGVGRSTALAATAWYLAKKGKRVLVIDMDFQ
ncbi:MAG: ParA family protein, partial [Gammaproteobacteria bacterium]